MYLLANRGGWLYHATTVKDGPMKTILVLFAVMLFSVAQSHADPQKLTTVYFTNAVLATALTDAGNTGLATNRSYICIDVGEIADLTAAQSTQDVRILTHTLLTHRNLPKLRRLR